MTTARFALLSTFVAIVAAAQQPVDVLIQGGQLIDGTGSPARLADVGLRGDRIVFVGDAAQSTR